MFFGYLESIEILFCTTWPYSANNKWHGDVRSDLAAVERSSVPVNNQQQPMAEGNNHVRPLLCSGLHSRFRLDKKEKETKERAKLLVEFNPTIQIDRAWHQPIRYHSSIVLRIIRLLWLTWVHIRSVQSISQSSRLRGSQTNTWHKPWQHPHVYSFFLSFFFRVYSGVNPGLFHGGIPIGHEPQKKIFSCIEKNLLILFLCDSKNLHHAF